MLYVFEIKTKHPALQDFFFVYFILGTENAKK